MGGSKRKARCAVVARIRRTMGVEREGEGFIGWDREGRVDNWRRKGGRVGRRE